MNKNENQKTINTKKTQKKTLTKSRNLIDLIKRQTKDLVGFNIKDVEKDLNNFDILNPSQVKLYAENQDLPKWSLNYLKHIYKTEIKKVSTILVRMILRNGKITSFTIVNSKPLFNFQDGTYIIDSSAITTDVATGQATLLFHQDLSLPFNLMVDVEKLKQGIYNNSDFEEIAQNINPDVLKSTVTSTLIKQVMAGGLLDKQLKTVTIIMIINLVFSGILVISNIINGILA